MEKTIYTKAERRQLRTLAAAAYERELSSALEELEQAFGRWRQGEITAFALSDAIHEFHQGAARQLWKFYNDLPTDLVVAAAVTRGALSEADLPEAVRRKLPRWAF